MATNWTRGSIAEIADHAMKLGMTPEDAERAFTIGARFIALGYSDSDVENMQLDYQRLQQLFWERWGR